MSKSTSLITALLQMKTAAEMESFLRDLCTPAEIREFEQRWEICQLLHAGELSYRDIAARVKTSVTTVTRVARFLRDEPYRGYALALKRLKK